MSETPHENTPGQAMAQGSATDAGPAPRQETPTPAPSATPAPAQWSEPAPPQSYYPPTPAGPQAPYAQPANVYLATAPVGANGQPYSNGLGTAGMVLGIVGVTLFWLPFVDFVCPVLALIFGWVGLSKVKNGTASNKGSAITGLVLGGISLAGSLIVVISLLGFAAAASTYHSY